jgi:hypothetical protein
MIPTGFKLYVGIAVAALTAAVVGGYTSGGDGIGPLSAGYKGGVGDHVSYAILLGVAFVAIIVGALLTIFHDADAEAVAEEMGTETAPVGQRPVAASIWPIIAGIGVGFITVGLAISATITGVGFVILTIVAFEWTMTAWADRATGDPATNAALRNQVMSPFEVPLLGLLGAGVVVLAMSRIFLAVSEVGAVVFGAVVASIILGVGVLVATQPKLSKNVMTGIVGIIAVGILAGGVWGAIEGTREIEEHHEEHSDDEPHEEGESAETSEAES